MSTYSSVALQRYFHICEELDSQPIVSYAIATGLFGSETEANAALDGLLQWLSLPEYSATDGYPLVILHGPVAKMLQAFTLNTVLYERFCTRYLSHQFHQIPILTAGQRELVARSRWFESTKASLNATFGSELVPVLSDWMCFHHHGPDIALVGAFPHQLFSLKELIPVGNAGAKKSLHQAPSHYHGHLAMN